LTNQKSPKITHRKPIFRETISQLSEKGTFRQFPNQAKGLKKETVLAKELER
jgi:hypothetical protein